MKIFTIIICFFCITFHVEANTDSLIINKIDNLEKVLNKYQDDLTKEKIDSVYISVEKIDEFISSNSGQDNFTPSLIALIVVLISTSGAVFIGIKQIKIQKNVAEENLKSQESQALDNLELAREQIRETSKMTLSQVRANNISQARINWMQDFRNEITRYNGEVAMINFYLQDVIDLIESGKKDQAKTLYNDQIERIKNARQYAFKIKLFLNTKENTHKELEDLINEYYKSALEDYKSVKNDFNDISDKILVVSRKILKDVWEQAKNEGNE